MKKTHLATLLAALLLGAPMAAQQTVDVDRTKYPDYSEVINPDWSLAAQPRREGAPARSRAVSGRPDHVNNAETRYFPPVFNQDGGSCGSASRICYMFSYELAAYRGLDASTAENYYPSHFVWLHTNSPTSITDQGKDAFVTRVGVPSAATYGGQTYSSLLGNQDCSNEDFGWMQGYDKWLEAMHNRMLKPAHFPQSIKTEEGREAVKNWLWNHNGDTDFEAGGICGIGVASGGVWDNIPKTAANDAAGVTNMWFVREWGTQVDHALTIVGYDDRIEFDLDKDGIIGEPEADEVGAWIIVNSWGGWCNDGFIYCPYAFAGSAFKNDGNPGERSFNGDFWWPEIYKVRKDYRPLRTIKLRMDYSRRSEIALSAGISADINATAPEKTTPFVHFTYAGDGNWGNSNPAPEVPMLGRWADGKLHTEPMEFGYDLTDLTEGYDMNKPLKYFFIIDTRDWAQGNGTIYDASIMDYQYDLQGIETPFGVGEGVEIRNAGDRTIISVVVYGSSYYAPQNVAFDGTTLTWQAPQRSALEVASYSIYRDGMLVGNVTEGTMTFTPKTPATSGEYGVSALYSDDNESAVATARVPMTLSAPNMGVELSQGGLTIPGVFATRYQQATIEYWIKPASIRDWNQSGGPGWGTFMFHANRGGAFTAGWDTSNRLNTGSLLQVGKWTHVAIVVNSNKMSVYIDGVNRGTVNSTTYSGLGGFGDLVFSSNGAQNAQDAQYDEIRIWNVARTEAQVKADMNTEFTGSVVPQGLIAYLKGDLALDDEGNQVMYDHVGGHHATLQGTYAAVAEDMPLMTTSTEAPTVSINIPESTIYAGMPVTLAATYSTAVNRLEWTAEGAGMERLAVATPTVTFASAGTHTVTLTALGADGQSATATCELTVEAAPEIDATFTMTDTDVPAGERVTFLATNPMPGYLYQWSMPGANVETASTVSTATSYPAQGTYTVTLTVTSPDGSSKSHSQQIKVQEVAPEADFSISPAVVVKGEEITLMDKSLYTPTAWEWHVGNANANYIAYDRYKTFAIDKPGIYEVTLGVTNDVGSSRTTRQRAVIVTNADSKNGLLFSNNAAAVTAEYLPFVAGQSKFTIDWWMNVSSADDDTNGMGDSESTMMLKTMSDGKMHLYIGGKYASTADGYVVPGEWHHYAVTFAGGKAKFYRDGVQIITRPISSTTALPQMATFRIGGSRAPFKGSIDELRVWNTTLTETQLKAYANAPIADVAKAEAEDGLKLYYQFNQSGGNVQDATANANHGVRTNFGPDGDAWGLSKGVFCLNFEESTATDVTETYLTNYTMPFASTTACVNSTLSTRTFAITGWTLENAVVSGNITTGAHVDKAKNECFTVTTKWDSFAAILDDHKVYQTVTLPAGYYTFEAFYGDFEGQAGKSYIVVAEGNTLPVTKELDQAIAYTAMKDKGIANSNKVNFILAEETTVSLGLLMNISGLNCLTLQSFVLMRDEVTLFEKSSDIVASAAQLVNDRLYYVTLPHHEKGITSWAIAQDGSALKSNAELGIEASKEDSRQQFAFISNDEGATHYLYHAAEKKFVGKDGSLTETPTDAVYLKAGAYDTTFVVCFDELHCINVDANQQMQVNASTTPDGGNSAAILPVAAFNPKEALSVFPAVEVEGIALNYTEVTLMEGKTLTLEASITPDYATEKRVTWTTSNPDVAIVVRGVVSALAPGTATITATAGDKVAACVVTVEEKYVPVTGIFLDQTEATLIEGDTLTLVATVTPADADDPTVTWETSDAAIAIVEDGVVVALTPGTVTITAKAGDREATCVITVEERYIPVTEIVLNHTEAELAVGESLKLTATVLPTDATDNIVSWSTSDKKVASARNGVVKGIAPGQAIITARIGEVTATCVVTVTLADGIDQTTGAKSVMNVYDITGRPVRLGTQSVDGLEQGVYIINGSKVVIK